jgi:CTP:phosphocholine cytidylyltransferase-like protein
MQKFMYILCKFECMLLPSYILSIIDIYFITNIHNAHQKNPKYDLLKLIKKRNQWI